MLFTQRLQKVRAFFLDPRWFFASLLFGFSVIGRLFLGFWSDWSQAFLVIGSTIALELLLGLLIYRRWVHPVSAVMTGISLSILLTTSPGVHWPYFVGALIAISSKYLFRYRGTHIFNPSNFAVAVIVLFAPQFGISNPSQWTNHIGPVLMILALGLIVAYRARRMDVVIAFVGTFLLLGFVRSGLQGLPLLWSIGSAVGPEFQLFTFFMLTDPKTTPSTRRGRILYGVIVGVLDAILRVLRVTYSPLYALVLTCLLVPFFNHHFEWTKKPAIKAAA